MSYSGLETAKRCCLDNLENHLPNPKVRPFTQEEAIAFNLSRALYNIAESLQALESQVSSSGSDLSSVRNDLAAIKSGLR